MSDAFTEEQAKRDKNPFELRDELTAHAAPDQFPKGTDILLTKYHGLFYVGRENRYGRDVY